MSFQTAMSSHCGMRAGVVWFPVLFSLYVDMPTPSHHVKLIKQTKRLRWSRGSMLDFGTQVRGLKPGWSRRIFQGEKILSTPSFGGEVMP
jgi:hypothetical protein